MSADVISVGMVTTVGLRAATTAAAVRAGINRFRESAFRDVGGDPITMAHLPPEALPQLAPSLARSSLLTERAERLVRLAGPALAEALAGEERPERVPVLLGLPDAHADLPAPAGPSFLPALATQSGVAFDVAHSKVFPQGRAAGLLALAEAFDRLRSGASLVVVGGVDTHADADLLAALDAQERVCAMTVRAGYIPGEGAGFLLLSPPGGRRARPAIARVTGAAHATEPGHLESPTPSRGDGLTATLARLFDAAALEARVETVYAGATGERFFAREWGIARLRHHDRFTEDPALEMPAATLGDTGAASGPLSVGLAAIGVRGGVRRAPCLVWSASDRAERGAALIGDV